MQVTRHTNFESLASHFGVWNELAAGVPFRLWQWVEVWWRHYGCEANGEPKKFFELFVLTVSDANGQLIGIAPWYSTITRSGLRVIRFLGDGEVCSDYLTILCRPQLETAVCETLAAWLTHANSDMATDVAEHWDRLQFLGVGATDPALTSLLEHLERGGALLHRMPALNSWRVALSPSWEEFLMVLSKPHRNRLRRADRELLQSGRVVVRHACDEAGLSQAFDILVSLHQRRWNSRGLPGCFASPHFEAFHRDISAQLFKNGKANIGWLELDGKPLAAEYRLYGDGVIYAYQSGVNPDHLDLHPGELANMAAVRTAIEHGYQAYDFLRGDEPYKARWRATPQPMLSVRVIANRASARLRHSAWLAGQNMKCWIKKGLHVAGIRKEKAATNS